MAKKRFERLEESHQKFIAEQHMFFVATAAPEGRVNMAPKDAPSLIILNPNRIAWINLTGAENETGAHLAESTRMTFMWCSFTQKPLILRAYGHSKLIHPRDMEWDDLIKHFPHRLGSRQILDVTIDFVLTSCGFGVPFYDYVGERDTLQRWEERKGTDGIRRHWEEFNQTSIEGKPTGLLSA